MFCGRVLRPSGKAKRDHGLLALNMANISCKPQAASNITIATRPKKWETMALLLGHTLSRGYDEPMTVQDRTHACG